MPTLQDVAQLAGVSIATVSKVLSNTPYVSDATRERVMQAVTELGYTPNLAGRALARGKTQIIAVIFPYIYDAIFQDPLMMQMLEGVESECTARGYNLLLSTPRLTEDGPDASYQQLIQSGYMDGMIAIDNVPLASVTKPALKRNIPAVVIGHHKADYSVRGDDQAGGAQAMNHLLELGHHNIGIITVREETNFSISARLRGIRQAAKEHNLDYAVLPVATGDFSVPGGARATEALIHEHPELTALICLNDRMALGAIQKLNDLGLTVPDDVSVIGYDNITISAYSSPPLTTIDQQATELGRTAARTLFDVFAEEQPSPVVLPTKLILRASTAAPRLTHSSNHSRD